MDDDGAPVHGDTAVHRDTIHFVTFCSKGASRYHNVRHDARSVGPLPYRPTPVNGPSYQRRRRVYDVAQRHIGDGGAISASLFAISAILAPPCENRPHWLYAKTHPHAPPHRNKTPAEMFQHVGIPGFSAKQKGFREYLGTLDGGVRGIRTLEPQSATNTLAGCPYRPLRHDSNLELCCSNGATAVYYTTPDGLDALYVAMSPPRNKR